MDATENQIVVYQPNETVRLNVWLGNETMWLTQEQFANLFGTKRPAITKHRANIYESGELEREGTCSILEYMGKHCGKFTKNICGICHDRFIVDRKEIFWTGASLKDAGRLTFAAAKMGAEVILGLLVSSRKGTSEQREYGKGKKASYRSGAVGVKVKKKGLSNE